MENEQGLKQEVKKSMFLGLKGLVGGVLSELAHTLLAHKSPFTNLHP